MAEAKLYGQNKGGMSINGIIKDYYAYAGENISAGDLVEYVNGVAGKTDYGTSEDTQVSAVDHAAYCPMSAVAIDENRVFIAHGSASSSNASNHLYGIVCTINGAKLSFGADTELSTADYSGATISACLLPNGSIFVAHRYSGSYYLYGMVCTVEGTTITAGTDTSIAGSVSSGWAISTCVLPNGNVFIAHSYSDSYHLYGIVVSINGTTITKGTDTSLVTSKNAGYSLAICLLPNGNVFIAHDYGSNHYFYGMVVKTNGTTITKGTDTQLVATQYSGYNKSSLIVLNDGRVFIAYGYGKTNGSTLHGILCTIEGTTITPGTTNALSTVGYTGDRISACLLANGKIFIAHCNGAGTTSRYLYGIICEVNNATITAGEDTELVSGNNEGSQISSLALQNGSIFVAHSIGSTANLNAQIWGIDEENNIPTNNIIATDYETQVRKVTVGQFDGVAKTSGLGGDDTGHNDLVSIWTRVYVPQEVTKTDNIFAKTWTKISNTEYKADDGTIFTVPNNDGDLPLSNAFDGNEDTYTEGGDAGTQDLAHSFQVTLPQQIKITKMKIKWYTDTYTQYFSSFKIEGSNDGSGWNNLYQTSAMPPSGMNEYTLDNADYYKYYRIYVTFTVDSGLKLYEWQTSEYIVLE